MARVAVANSVCEEDAAMQVCECGGAWSLVSEAVVPLRGHWYDSLVGRCSSCSAQARWVFDITSFYRPHPRVWASYEVSEP